MLKKGGIWVNATNLSATTRYYPGVAAGTTTTGRDCWRVGLLAMRITCSGGVTLTIEATLDDPERDSIGAASVVWFDVTSHAFALSTGVTGAASFVDQTDTLVIDVSAWARVRVKVVTSDATNAVKIVQLDNDDASIIGLVAGKLTTIAAKDFATQTTLAALYALAGTPTIPTAITKSDATDTSTLTTKGLIVGGAGDLAIRGTGAPSTTVTLAVVAGQYVPIVCSRVMAATTATGIVGLS